MDADQSESVSNSFKVDGWRSNLVTKEVMLDYYKGKIKSGSSNFSWEESVQEDLETFFENLRNGKEEQADVATYFFPKLTEEELKLIEIRDPNHLQEYVWQIIGRQVDVDSDEMENSESDSKYVRAKCVRYTFILKILKLRSEVAQRSCMLPHYKL